MRDLNFLLELGDNEPMTDVLVALVPDRTATSSSSVVVAEHYNSKTDDQGRATLHFQPSPTIENTTYTLWVGPSRWSGLTLEDQDYDADDLLRDRPADGEGNGVPNQTLAERIAAEVARQTAVLVARLDAFQETLTHVESEADTAHTEATRALTVANDADGKADTNATTITGIEQAVAQLRADLQSIGEGEAGDLTALTLRVTELESLVAALTAGGGGDSDVFDALLARGAFDLPFDGTGAFANPAWAIAFGLAVFRFQNNPNIEARLTVASGQLDFYVAAAGIDSANDLPHLAGEGAFTAAGTTFRSDVTLTQWQEATTTLSGVEYYTGRITTVVDPSAAQAIGLLAQASQPIAIDLSGVRAVKGGEDMGLSAAEVTALINRLRPNPFTDDEQEKLTGIQEGAEVNPTALQIKQEYESNADTNAFTDAEQTKLADLLPFTSTDRDKLAGIQEGAEVNPDAATIKSEYESNANTNAFTDDEKRKLAGLGGGNYHGKIEVTPNNIARAENLDGTYQITLSDIPVDALNAAGVNALEIWFGNEAIELINPWAPVETDVLTATIDTAEETRIGLTNQEDIRVLAVFRVRSGGGSRFVAQTGTILTIGQVGTATSSDIANEVRLRSEADKGLGQRIDGLSIPDASDTAPGNTPGSPSAGTSDDYARADHDHGIRPGTQGGGTDQTARDAAAAAQLDIDTVIEIGPDFVHNETGPKTLGINIRHPINAYREANVMSVSVAGQPVVHIEYDNTVISQDTLAEVSATSLRNIWAVRHNIPDGQGGTTSVQTYSEGSYIPVDVRLTAGRGGTVHFQRVIDVQVIAPDDSTLEFATTVQQVAGSNMQDPGSRDVAARADHVHGLELATGSGLSFNASDELNSENLNQAEVDARVAAGLRDYTPPALPFTQIGSLRGTAGLRNNAAQAISSSYSTIVMVRTLNLIDGMQYDATTGAITLPVGIWQIQAQARITGTSDRGAAHIALAIFADPEGVDPKTMLAFVEEDGYRDATAGLQVVTTEQIIASGNNDTWVITLEALSTESDSTVTGAWIKFLKVG